MRPYTRSLDPKDYAYLSVKPLRVFEQEIAANGVPYRLGQHEHRLWEYASILQQLRELHVRKSASILDVGSGGSFLPPYLCAVEGYTDVTLVDSMVGGDITKTVTQQMLFYKIRLPVLRMSAEDMSAIASDRFDVTMCVSVIEHVDADKHDQALRELCRVTKPGGLIFITSDYFRETSQVKQSPWHDWQHTAYTKELVLDLPNRMDADFVDTPGLNYRDSLDLDYRGDFVHNYSFVNICLRKRQHPLGS